MSHICWIRAAWPNPFAGFGRKYNAVHSAPEFDKGK
jgi:hypothetical protein